jgi:glycerophosphoryl diester phosphodiesterase
MKNWFIFILILASCDMNNQTKEKTVSESMSQFDIEGHRGCRGLMPENTLPAFQRALELGVNTLEMDLIISGDKQVVVSHEPYFRSGISQKPDGTPVTKEEELSLNMYKMNYDSIKMFDVGTLPDSNHLNRENIPAYRPLFSEVVELAMAYCAENKKPLPNFNIEIKRLPQYDGIFHPGGEEFVNLVIEQVEKHGISEQVIIQSFDPEALRITKAKAPELRIALLIENEDSPQQNVTDLGFTPDIYSSYYKMVDKELIQFCHSQDILVIPWTVNSEEDIRAMITIGVDGIISDYPDRVIEIIKTYANN